MLYVSTIISLISLIVNYVAINVHLTTSRVTFILGIEKYGNSEYNNLTAHNLYIVFTYFWLYRNTTSIYSLLVWTIFEINTLQT